MNSSSRAPALLSSILKLLRTKAPLALIALVLLISLNCGKRKPPLPPTERVQQRVQLSGFQRGNSVILSCRMPDKNASASSVQHISRADIYRLAEPLSSPTAVSEEEFASRSTLVAALNIRDEDFGSKILNYTDTLQLGGQAARLRYAIRLVNATGQKAAFSNFLLLEPAPRVAGSPTSLLASVTQDAIKLSLTAPTSNVDGSGQVNLLGYNIYRSNSDQVPGKLLNTKPV